MSKAATLIALLATLLIPVTRRLTRIEIVGASMRPALRPGDWTLVDRRAYRSHPPRPGDVVLAHHPHHYDQLLVKRVARVHPDGSLHLQGDNPHQSTDSRHFGPLPPYLLEGRVLGRYWPWPSIARRRSTSPSVGKASSGS